MAVEDDRLNDVLNEKNNAINNATNTYDNMIKESDKYYQAQIDASKDYEKKQTEIQNANTNLTIDKINQEKDKATKDYEKEQKASYTDYQKAIDNYGVNAEKMATNGLTGTGYAESSKVNMYNTYQNRYATARENYNNAILNYNNSIKEAQLANSSALAQIAYQTLQTQLQLSLEGFQYKNTLLETKLNAVNSEIDRYDKKYQDVLNQINTEKQFEESIRQYNESLAEQQRQFNEELNYKKQKDAADRAVDYAKIAASKSTSSSTNNRITSVNKLSDNAYNLLQTLEKENSRTNSGLGPYMSDDVKKERIKGMIYSANNAGTITEPEAEYIYNYLKLDD